MRVLLRTIPIVLFIFISILNNIVYEIIAMVLLGFADQSASLLSSNPKGAFLCGRCFGLSILRVSSLGPISVPGFLCWSQISRLLLFLSFLLAADLAQRFLPWRCTL